MNFDLANYYAIFIYFLFVCAFAGGVLLITQIIGPRRQTPVKQMPYESGMDPIGDAHQRFDVKFYLIAILFLVFDVELLFLYPWAVATYRLPDLNGNPGLIPEMLRLPVFWEMLAFLLTLVVAYVYAWRKGVFRWR